jgi:D-amino-acid dehydrogenase
VPRRIEQGEKDQMQRESDVIVLGAGIVGLGVALKVQEKGLAVTLIDRQEPGSGTSYGNAGIIERSSLLPYAFPRDVKELIGYALNGRKDAHYHLSALFGAAPWLFRYWWNSARSRYQHTVKAALPLIEHCLSEHDLLIEAAGAGNLIRRTGWIKAFRSAEKVKGAFRDAEFIKGRGLQVEFLDKAELAKREPFLDPTLEGAIHYRDPANVADPQALSLAYLALFQKRGGVFVQGDARTLAQNGAGWQVETAEGIVKAKSAVVALGPWAQDFAASLGYRLSMGVKRGYHRHYAPANGAILNHTVYDADNSYVIAPMLKGVRLTTGAEFAKRDAPPTPVQLARIEPDAKRFFPLGEPVEKEPWMGSRPCTGDMLPIIGEAPRHKGLWFSFGHAHHGLTMAAVTGRLVAEMIAGDEPFTDPTPYRVDRF